MHSEKDIITALNGGSHEAFRRIYDLHKYRISNIVSRLVASRPVAEELVQRVFVKLWESRAIIDHEGSLAAYLNTIARNEVYSHWRKALNKHGLDVSLDHTLPGDVVLEQEIENDDYRAYLLSLAEGLPARCRAIFDMRFAAQMSYREIAREMGIAESTVENQIGKALRHVRRKLDNSTDIVIMLAASGFFA